MTSLSNRGYPMLREFTTRTDQFVMTYEQAQHYDQRPFRSMLMRGWIKYDRRKHGFMITRAGRDAWHEFNSTDIHRKTFDKPLTAYFDPTAYGLKLPAKTKAKAVAA